MSIVEFLFASPSSMAVNDASSSSSSSSLEGPLVCNIKPLNLTNGQCTWCGKYGHGRGKCPLLR